MAKSREALVCCNSVNTCSMSGYVESDVPAGQAACFPYCGGGDAKLLGANAPARRIEKMSFIVR